MRMLVHDMYETADVTRKHKQHSIVQ